MRRDTHRMNHAAGAMLLRGRASRTCLTLGSLDVEMARQDGPLMVSTRKRRDVSILLLLLEEGKEDNAFLLCGRAKNARGSDNIHALPLTVPNQHTCCYQTHP